MFFKILLWVVYKLYPFLFEIFSRKIASYGVCILVAFLLLFALAVKRAKGQNIAMEDVLIVGVTAIGIGYVAAKLTYIAVTFSLSDIRAMLSAGNFSFLLGDGTVFYGGLIGGIFGAFLGARIAKLRLAALESSIVPFLPLGHAIGRIGCALGGCCYGMEYYGFGAIYYPDTIFPFPAHVGYFPVQFVEAFLNLCIMVYLLHFSKKERREWALLLRYLILYAVVRFGTEFLRGDLVRGQFFTLSTSQWISVVLFFVCVLLSVVRHFRANPKKS